MTQNFPDNTLYEMDNLVVLRGMNNETVDLIATDPPFNIKRNRSGTAGHYVDNWKWGDTGILPDQWKWNEVHPKWLEEIKDNHIELYHAIDAAKHCQGEDTAAFLCFLSVRLIEMHRILKPTGSIYLHCDPTASHYIKMCMDAIFGKKNFRNEIVWKRQTANNAVAKRYGRIVDYLIFYTKGGKYTWNQQYGERSENSQKEFRHQDDDGRIYRTHDLTAPGRDPNRMFEWQGTIPYRNWAYSKDTLDEMLSNGEILLKKDGTVSASRGRKVYLDEQPGVKLQTIWDDITKVGTSIERTGSPDQKPLALYERIIKASSNEGDLVLDPFCGCATTIIAADNLKRRWIGIDRRVDARYHIITRLMGISKKERERIEKYAVDKKWLDNQMQQYEMHYQTEPPTRTDQDNQTSPELPHTYNAEPENPLTHAEMHEILVDKFGLQCWGCNYIPPDKRYLHLDHIIPKSDGGTNHIDNRALLCQPCNTIKSNTMSLNALRRKNKKEGYTQPNEEINLQQALTWTKHHLIQIIRETPHQYKLFNQEKS